MATSFSMTDMSLWPSLGQTIADLARNEQLNRETLNAGVYVRSLDRANGMERTGAYPIDQAVYGGIVAGNYLDTLNAGTAVPRDAVTQTFDAQRGMITLYTGTGNILDSLA